MKQIFSHEYKEVVLPGQKDLDYHYATLAEETAAGTKIVARLDGEDNILVEYGEMELDIASVSGFTFSCRS